MKKIFIPTMAAALVVGMTSTSFAANPFSDVPENHWAYRSVEKLRSEGIIEGYGDDTYQGDKHITRFEMAQMVAKALALTPRTNISTSSRVELDKLSAEFQEELENLGVRIDELEKNSDKVKWTGKIEYTYTKTKTDPYKTGKEKSTANGAVFRLEPTAEVNENWTANARLDAEGDMKNDTTTDVTLKRVWAEGDYEKFNVKLGKFEFFTNENGLVWDTEISGAAVTLGNKWKFTALGGRIATDGVGGGILGEFDNDADNSDVIGANLQYDAEEGLFGGFGFYNVKDDDFKTANYSKGGTSDKAEIWSANVGYAFGENLSLWGSYAQNSKADTEKYSWQTQLDYGTYGDNPEKGDWSVFGGYRRYGTNVSFAPTTDDVQAGTKGWFIGAMYAPFKNVGVGARYFKGKYITNGGDADNLWGRVELFF